MFSGSLIPAKILDYGHGNLKTSVSPRTGEEARNSDVKNLSGGINCKKYVLTDGTE